MKTYYYLNRDVLGLKAGTVLEETAGGRIKLDVGFGGIPCFVPHDLPPEISKITLADPKLGDDWELDEGDQPRLWKKGDSYCADVQGRGWEAGLPGHDEHGLAIRYIVRRKEKPEPKPEDDGFVRYEIFRKDGLWYFDPPNDYTMAVLCAATSLVNFHYIETESGDRVTTRGCFAPDDPPKCVVCRKEEG